MQIDVYSSAGAKKGQKDLPEALFAVPVNNGLVHQALLMQQGNRRKAIAHAKNRHEVAGSTRKLYGQKHTGQARRGSIRSPLLRGGGKAFGPRSERNFTTAMPRAMRHRALVSCLSMQAGKKGVILGLEGYGTEIKTKKFMELISKLPVEAGRRILFVLPEKNEALMMSSRNVPNVKIILVNYLNPEDVLGARSIIFVGESIEKAVEIFTAKKERSSKKEMETTKDSKESNQPSPAAAGLRPAGDSAKKKVTKKPAAKKAKTASKKKEPNS